MSRIGKKIINVPAGVTLKVGKELVEVKGPKGQLNVPYDPAISISLDGSVVSLSRSSEDKDIRAKHGLYRALLQGAVTGVTDGYTKKLDIVGVGYRAEIKGKFLFMAVGYSHPVYFKAPDNVKVEVPAPTQIVVSGIDKQLVGQVAAKIRAIREPEPYKGKGIKYDKEVIRRKAGKTASR
ncbi:MAG: 50S ribosomal protein L6 [Bacteroidetes bacterium]|nr:50S ribosomal protein L6 [Bacteroidota bacterium]